MFVCGDLNYRTRFQRESESKVNGTPKTPKKPDEKDEPDNGSGYVRAMKLIEEEKFEELYAVDELCMALDQKECLVGFETLPCKFLPTFKVARKEGYVYNEKRTPR